jgi:hypothetical protein
MPRRTVFRAVRRHARAPVLRWSRENLHDPRQIDLDAHDVVENIDPAGDRCHIADAAKFRVSPSQ